MKKPQRLKPEERREQILVEALRQAGDTHYTVVTRDGVADALGLSGPAILYHFKSMQRLKWAIVQRAIDEENLTIVGQAAIANDLVAGPFTVPGDLRRRALDFLVNGAPESADAN